MSTITNENSVLNDLQGEELVERAKGLSESQREREIAIARGFEAAGWACVNYGPPAHIGAPLYLGRAADLLDALGVKHNIM